MLNGKITIELCDEDRTRLDRILSALERQLNCDRCVDSVAAIINDLETAGAAQGGQNGQADDLAHTDPEKVVVTQEPEKAVTMADIQSKVRKLSGTGEREKVKSIITSYAEKVSLIPEDKLGEVWDKLAELEG